MKDRKSLLLLVLSMLLIIVSLALLWTWGYNYGQQQKGKPKQIGGKEKQVSNNDTVNQMYQTAKTDLSELDSVIYLADSLKLDLGGKMSELYQLRDEIKGMLSNPNNDGQVQNAQQKIEALQSKVDELLDQNKNIIRQNRRLTSWIRKMSKNTSGISIDPTEKDAEVVPDNNKKTQKQIDQFVIQAWADVDGQIKETKDAATTSGFKGSFMLFNPSSRQLKNEVYIVVTRPDGKTLKSSGWETGSFEAPTGRKIYTTKVFSDLSSGESKKLNFNFAVDEASQGKYQVQVFFAGELVSGSEFMLN